MGFVSAPSSCGQVRGPCWWFIFSGQNVLVHVAPGKAELPFIPDPSSLGLKIKRNLHFGTLDGLPCFIGEIEPEAALPEGMALVGLRQLFAAGGEKVYQVAGRAFQILEFERNHRFCGHCGAGTRDKQNERAKVCTRCGLTVFPRMSPAMIVSVRKSGQILLARAPRFPEGMYSVLAGFVELGESLEQCVQREVREEVGVEVNSIRYFGSQPWPFPNSLMVGFTAEYAGGEIRIDHNEIAEAGWFAPDRFPSRIPDKISIARKLIDAFLAEAKAKD